MDEVKNDGGWERAYWAVAGLATAIIIPSSLMLAYIYRELIPVYEELQQTLPQLTAIYLNLGFGGILGAGGIFFIVIVGVAHFRRSIVAVLAVVCLVLLYLLFFAIGLISIALPFSHMCNIRGPH